MTVAEVDLRGVCRVVRSVADRYGRPRALSPRTYWNSGDVPDPRSLARGAR